MIYMFTLLLSLLGASAVPAAPAPVSPPPPSAYDGASIEHVIAQHLAGLRACYETHAPGRVSGARMRLRFTLGADGRVAHAQIESDHLAAPGAARCVQRFARSWQFPPPPVAGAQFMFNFRFQ